MKELDSFTVERLEEITELKALSFPPSHAESAALARIALAAKRDEPDYHIVRRLFTDGYGTYIELDVYIEKLDASKSKDDHGGEIIPVYTTPQLNSPQGWIKCSDQMPEVDDWVVGWHIEGYHRIVSWQKSYGNYLARSASHCWQGDNDDVELEGSITHWMPLPAAPEKPL